MINKENIISYIKSKMTDDWRECWGCYYNIIQNLEQMSNEEFVNIMKEK